MAKQKGIVKLEGTIGDITFFKSTDGYLARENAPISAQRLATDPAFQRTRENNAEFANAGKAGKLLRKAIGTLLQNAKDGRVVSRLTQTMMKVVKADTTSPRGFRNAVDGQLGFLKNFDFNKNANLGSTVAIEYTTTLDRASGKLILNVPSFIPVNKIVAPAGTTHFSIVSAGVEVDFNNETYVSETNSTAVLPLNNQVVNALVLQNTVTAASTLPLLLVMGIQFYQQVNGTNYPLKNGAFNSLSIIAIDNN
jgi:hypothetical protein